MTLYNCPDCRRWHAGSGHVCTDPLPEIRDQRSLESAVVQAARAVDEWAERVMPFLRDDESLDDLHKALLELDGLDRPVA